MIFKLKKFLLPLTIATFFSATFSFAREIPYLSSPVIDEVGLLSREEQQRLASFIQGQRSKMQIQVWITSLQGESIEGLSYRAASEWKLGDKDLNNGLLLVVAPKDRRMRFEVGRGLEGDIPDILAGRILDHVARPQFRKANYYQGIQHALEQAVNLRSGGADAAKIKERYSSDESEFGLTFWIFVIIIFALQAFARFSTKHHLRKKGITWYGYGGFGGGGWGGGSGGGWSGGGGSFGGGGSSSSW